MPNMPNLRRCCSCLPRCLQQALPPDEVIEPSPPDGPTGCMNIFTAANVAMAHKRFLRLGKPPAGSSFRVRLPRCRAPCAVPLPCLLSFCYVTSGGLRQPAALGCPKAVGTSQVAGRVAQWTGPHRGRLGIPDSKKRAAQLWGRLTP